MLEIIRGDDVRLEFTFVDSDGVAIDLTGAESQEDICNC